MMSRWNTDEGATQRRDGYVALENRGKIKQAHLESVQVEKVVVARHGATQAISLFLGTILV